MAFRLGGGRSIHLSYEGVGADLPTRPRARCRTRSSMGVVTTPDLPPADDRPLLDERTGDEYGEGWGDRDDEAARIRQLQEDVPPHHGD